MDIKTKPTQKTIHVDRLMRRKKLVINKGINKGINNLSAYKWTVHKSCGKLDFNMVTHFLFFLFIQNLNLWTSLVDEFQCGRVFNVQNGLAEVQIHKLKKRILLHLHSTFWIWHWTFFFFFLANSTRKAPNIKSEQFTWKKV